jgi:hypothetical protein
MGLVLSPPTINFLYNTQILEYAANFSLLDTPNYSGYMIFKKNGNFLCDVKPEFSYFNGKFSIDISDVLPLDMQPPIDASLSTSGMHSGILADAYGKLGIEVGESYGNPITNTITDTLEIRQIIGQSSLWANFPSSGAVLLHSLYSLYDNRSESVVKNILFDSPEYISVYSPGGSISFTVTVYSTAIAGSPINHSINLQEGCNYIAVSPTQLGIPSNALGYDINILGTTLRYKILQSVPDNVLYILYENGIGGVETLMCTGSKKIKARSEKQNYYKLPWTGDNQRRGLIIQPRIFGQKSIDINTGYISPQHAAHLGQLICGRIWLIDRVRNRFIRYYVNQDSIDLIDTKDDLHSVSFTITEGFKNSGIHNF